MIEESVDINIESSTVCGDSVFLDADVKGNVVTIVGSPVGVPCLAIILVALKGSWW